MKEALAYRSSHSWLSKNLGALIQSPGESILFVLILMLIVFVDLKPAFFWHIRDVLKAAWLKLVPLGLVGYGLWRLYAKMRLFEKVRHNLSTLPIAQKKPMLFCIANGS